MDHTDDDEARERRQTAVRWLVGLCEPLLATGQHLSADDGLAGVLSATPRWGSAWFAGLIADTLATLPGEDPWRHLGGRVETAAGCVHTPDADPVPPPAATGAQTRTASGTVEPFGTVCDVTDLIAGEAGDPTMDLSLAAVAADLPAGSAGLTAIARMGFGPTRDALDLLFDDAAAQADPGASPDSAGAAMLAQAGAALRAVTHRRRAYTGASDLFTWVYGIGCLVRADRVSAGGPDDRVRADELDRARLEDGLYAETRMGG